MFPFSPHVSWNGCLAMPAPQITPGEERKWRKKKEFAADS